MLRSMTAQKAAIGPRIAKAETHRSAGDYPAAMQILGALFQTHPGDRDVLQALALTWGAMGGKGQALALVERALRLYPADVELRLEQAALLEQLDRAAEAEQTLAGFAW
jgi:Flp pilus assembly protein TadD